MVALPMNGVVFSILYEASLDGDLTSVKPT